MQEFIERMERDQTRRKRRRRIVWLVVGLFVLLYGLPRVFIVLGDAAKDDFDFGAYDQDFELDMSKVAFWYHLARYSPLTWGTANTRRAELHAAAGSEMIHDGMPHRSRRHFEAAWTQFERGAAIDPYEDLIHYAAMVARHAGQAERILSLAERYPQHAGAIAESRRLAFLIEGRYADAAPMLLDECLGRRFEFLCKQAVVAAAVAGDLASAERAARRLVELYQDDAPEPAGPDLGVPRPAEMAGADRQSLRHRWLQSARILLARVLIRAGKHAAALTALQPVLAAGEPHTWPLAVVAKARVLRALDRATEADAFLLAPDGEQAVRQKDAYLTGLNWDVLALARAQAHLRAGRPEPARESLEARFRDRKSGMRWYSFERLDVILDHRALVPGDMLTGIRADLAALPADSVRQVRTWVGLLRCRARLAAADPAGARRCLDDLDPDVAPRPNFFLRYYAAMNTGQSAEAAALCAAEAERAGLDSRLLEKWLLADLAAGRFAEALARLEQAPNKLLHAGFMDMGPERARALLQGLASLASGQGKPADLPAVDEEALRKYAAPRPRLHKAMRALAHGDGAAATRALGDQNLHYSLGLQRDWRPFARALFDLADPSGRDLVFVLRDEAGARARTFGMDLARLLWLQAEIAQLQPAEEAARTRIAMARHQAAVPIIAELNWGR